MKSVSIPLVLLAIASAALANTAPTVVIQSAAMRPGTTLMDVVYRVNDPDDATVKTRALAFVDGVRSFGNVLKPVTFVEGTAAKLGDAVSSNTNHTLTWDVAADWNVDLGQVKFEVLAMDARGLLPIDWITIPAAGGNLSLTISKDSPSDIAVLDALFWQYADGNPGLTLAGGELRGNVASAIYDGIELAAWSSVGFYARPFIFKIMNLDPADLSEVTYADNVARAGIFNSENWHAVSRSYGLYENLSIIHGWGEYPGLPTVMTGITKIAAGYRYGLALKSDGTVVGWGDNEDGADNIPAGLKDVTAIAACSSQSLALKSNGTVVGWGRNNSGQTTIPPGLTGVVAIAAGGGYGLALKSDGTVVSWGGTNVNTIPAGLTGVVAIAAGELNSLALKNDGTVVSWGFNYYNITTIPTGLTGVTAIAAGDGHNLALKSDGTVVGWGDNGLGQITIPAGLSGVTAIAAGGQHSLALKSDGSVVGWGAQFGWLVPGGLGGVTAIAAGSRHNFALRTKVP